MWRQHWIIMKDGTKLNPKVSIKKLIKHKRDRRNWENSLEDRKTVLFPINYYYAICVLKSKSEKDHHVHTQSNVAALRPLRNHLPQTQKVFYQTRNGLTKVRIEDKPWELKEYLHFELCKIFRKALLSISDWSSPPIDFNCLRQIWTIKLFQPKSANTRQKRKILCLKCALILLLPPKRMYHWLEITRSYRIANKFMFLTKQKSACSV